MRKYTVTMENLTEGVINPLADVIRHISEDLQNDFSPVLLILDGRKISFDTQAELDKWKEENKDLL